MTLYANADAIVAELSDSELNTVVAAIVEDDTYETDPRHAYLEWLAMEARILRIELYGDQYFADKELTPCNTFAHDFHFGGGDWRAKPQPSTRAEAVMRLVGVKFPTRPQTLFEEFGMVVRMMDKVDRDTRGDDAHLSPFYDCIEGLRTEAQHVEATDMADVLFRIAGAMALASDLKGELDEEDDPLRPTVDYCHNLLRSAFDGLERLASIDREDARLDYFVPVPRGIANPATGMVVTFDKRREIVVGAFVDDFNGFEIFEEGKRIGIMSTANFARAWPVRKPARGVVA